MYAQEVMRKSHARLKALSTAVYLIKEFHSPGEKAILKIKGYEEVTGFENAIRRAEELINKALHHRRLSSEGRKKLREEMKYDLVAWKVEIVRV